MTNFDDPANRRTAWFVLEPIKVRCAHDGKVTMKQLTRETSRRTLRLKLISPLYASVSVCCVFLIGALVFGGLIVVTPAQAQLGSGSGVGNLSEDVNCLLSKKCKSEEEEKKKNEERDKKCDESKKALEKLEKELEDAIRTWQTALKTYRCNSIKGISQGRDSKSNVDKALLAMAKAFLSLDLGTAFPFCFVLQT